MYIEAILEVRKVLIQLGLQFARFSSVLISSAPPPPEKKRLRYSTLLWLADGTKIPTLS